MIISLFDCDGTLYRAQFGRGLLAYAASHGLRRRVLAYYVALLPHYVLRKLHVIESATFNRPLISYLGRLLAGSTAARGHEALEWVFRSYLWPTRRPDVLARLQKDQSQGHKVILLSGVFKPCLEMIGAALGVEDVVGTNLEVIDGVYTGAIVPPVVTGGDKLGSLRKYLGQQDLEVDWSSSYAYADSDSDRSILESFGHPVAVYPDRGLSAIAQDRNWEVIGAA